MCCLSVGEPGVWREKVKLVDTHAFQHLEHLEHRLTDSCPMLLPFFPVTRWPVWADLAGKWPDLMTSTKDAPKLPYTKKTTINGKFIKILWWFIFALLALWRITIYLWGLLWCELWIALWTHETQQRSIFWKEKQILFLGFHDFVLVFRMANWPQRILYG